MAKGNEELDPREALAARTVCTVYGAGWVVIPRDILGAPPGTHDFDLSDGSTVMAVEVSTIADQVTVENSQRWSRFFPNLTAVIPGLENGWQLVVSSGGNPRKLLAGAGQWLADLEQSSLRRASTDRWQEFALAPEVSWPPGFATLRALESVGVMYVEVADEFPAEQCDLMIVEGGYTWSSSDEEYFSDFVSEQLAGPHASDVEKVERAAADRRAVFLWLHAQSHLDVIRRLDNGLLVGELTNTGALYEVWVGRVLAGDVVLAYRWQAGEGWVVFQVPAGDDTGERSDVER